MQSASRRTEIFGLSPAGTGALQISASLEVGDQVAFVVVVEVSIVEHLPEPASGISLHHLRKRTTICRRCMDMRAAQLRAIFGNCTGQIKNSTLTEA